MRHSVFGYLLFAFTACATVQPRSASLLQTSVDSAADYRPRVDRNVITRAEIVGIETLSSYDVITILRRQWLSARGTLTADGTREAPPVYVGGIRFGNSDSLKNIAASTVDELRFLDGLDATTRFGTGHTAGAILVTLRRR